MALWTTTCSPFFCPRTGPKSGQIFTTRLQPTTSISANLEKGRFLKYCNSKNLRSSRKLSNGFNGRFPRSSGQGIVFEVTRRIPNHPFPDPRLLTGGSQQFVFDGIIRTDIIPSTASLATQRGLCLPARYPAVNSAFSTWMSGLPSSHRVPCRRGEASLPWCSGWPFES